MIPGRPPKNPGASVRARLYNLSRERGAEFQLLLSEFAIERLLYRLGISKYKDRFVLKGAMLFKLWTEGRQRATWDLDLLGRGQNSVEGVVTVLRDLCGVAAPDGIVFDPDSVTGEEIGSADEYSGVRVLLKAHLAEARIPVQVDIGFGDAPRPAPAWETYPTLLDQPPPRILAYPREAVVAEKLDAMLTLGVTNSRMKDFYDIQVLASRFAFKGRRLSEAIRATLGRRGTPYPTAVPLVMTREFLSAPERQIQWRASLHRGRLDAPPNFGEVADTLCGFLWPMLDALAKGEDFDETWLPGGPWR